MKKLPPNRDEHIRRATAERLSQHLVRGDELVARCMELASGAVGDQIGSLNAAARLILANARVAQALAQMARVERRTRSVTERIQPPAPELNSKTPAQRRAEIRVKMEQMLREMDAEKRLQPESPHEDAHIRLVDEEGDDGLDWWSRDLGKT